MTKDYNAIARRLRQLGENMEAAFENPEFHEPLLSAADALAELLAELATRKAWIEDYDQKLRQASDEKAELLAENERLRGAGDNVVLAYGMGWDMDGVIGVLRDALGEGPTQRQPRTEEARTNMDHALTERKAHTLHCYQGEFSDGCKYGDPECPARPL